MYFPRGSLKPRTLRERVKDGRPVERQEREIDVGTALDYLGTGMSGQDERTIRASIGARRARPPARTSLLQNLGAPRRRAVREPAGRWGTVVRRGPMPCTESFVRINRSSLHVFRVESFCGGSALPAGGRVQDSAPVPCSEALKALSAIEPWKLW